ncbi:MAG: glycosidase [Armatimonadota bacterium]|nr:MAG: glycosidase [Armatimonadota bacterium]
MLFTRHPANPVLGPSDLWWEYRATFNCAAAEKDGRVYLLYRAIGDDPLSRLGLAVSEDGVLFERYNLPVFEGDPDNPWERLGVEDPRATFLDGTFYVTYVAASVYPAGHPRPAFSFGAPWRTRVCLAATDDLQNYRRLGVILPDSDNKDVVLFPEKIRGRYCLMHREYPDMWVAFSEDLIHWTDHRRILSPRPGYWDCNRIGAGAPPFKTELGWVEIYHGVDDDRRYMAGIALLDLEDPSRVIGRSAEPLLVPSEWYECEGLVPNVCFPSGVIERDGVFYVYYGAADRYVALATVSRKDLLDYLARLRE